MIEQTNPTARRHGTRRLDPYPPATSSLVTAIRAAMRSSRTHAAPVRTPERVAYITRDVRTKRIYDPSARQDGYRILIDHVWPRGMSHDCARLDRWARELAPSDELRTWFDHRSPRFKEFRERYREELAAQSDLIDELRDRAQRGRVTVLNAARDREHNNAVVLAEMIRDA